MIGSLNDFMSPRAGIKRKGTAGLDPQSPAGKAAILKAMAKRKKKAPMPTTTTRGRSGSLSPSDPNWKLIGKAVSGNF